MCENLWRDIGKSVCVIRHFDQSGQMIASGTGFKAEGVLITNNHVIQVPQDTSTEIIFTQHCGTKRFLLSHEELLSKLIDGEPENSWDYAIIDMGMEGFDSISDLILLNTPSPQVGAEIALFGYHFDNINLSMNKGIISSKYSRAGVQYLQLDASVNHGNSGGPLINASDGTVIGIVTRKMTGLTTALEQLESKLNSDYQLLHGMSNVKIGGISPMQAIAETQAQMQVVIKEIKRSANVGVGFAYELDKIKQSLQSLK